MQEDSSIAWWKVDTKRLRGLGEDTREGGIGLMWQKSTAKKIQTEIFRV